MEWMPTPTQDAAVSYVETTRNTQQTTQPAPPTTGPSKVTGYDTQYQPTGIGNEEVDTSSDDTLRMTTTGPMTQHRRSGECLEAPTGEWLSTSLQGKAKCLTSPTQLN